MVKGFIPAVEFAAVVFEPVRRVAALMQGFEKPWFVAGGWALDLFLKRETRAHEDIEIAIFRRDQEAIWRHLSDWEMERVLRGERDLWRGEWLAPPIHEIHARHAGGELEILLDEAWADTWRFRRNLAVSRPIAEVGLQTPDGVPLLVPEIVLLYKAKDSRPRDEDDFRAAFPILGEQRRRWLADILRVCHPDHPWLSTLAFPPASR